MRIWSLALIACPCVALACTGTDVAAPESDEVELSQAFMRGGAHHSQADVVLFSDPATAVGSSRLTRNWTGVAARLHTTGLGAGHAVTMWAVIFNDPSGCVGPCDEPDLFNPAAVVDVVYVAGHVVGGSGQATFSGHRNVGDNSGSLFAQLGAPAPGLVDPHGAEIHFIVRDHGPAVAGMIPAQIHTFQGGCDAASSFGLGNGTYPCEDVQFAVHMP
jgi:hypothetical protein